MMDGIDRIEKKRQKKSKDKHGDVPAKDSWWIYYTDPEKNPKLVFKDPALRVALFTPEQIEYIREELEL